MKKLNSLAIHCVADADGAEVHIIHRDGISYAVTAHLTEPAHAEPEPELPLP